jgi:anaerobic selenocysteine-containing dehydrogenase
VTGNLDREGGVMFPRPAADLVELATRLGQRGHFDRWRSRVRGLPEFGGELPAATLAEEIDTPGDGQIKALITIAGNPVLSAPNGRRLEAALEGLELMISIDVYQNETTRHADYILPTSFGFERDHYDLAFYALAVRNVARFNPGFVPAPPGVRDDFSLTIDLARRIRRHGGGARSRKLDVMLLGLHKLGPKRLLDLALRLGPHRTSLSALAAHPAGIDFGALAPALPARLGHADRRIRLVPAVFAADLERAARGIDEVPGDDLVLIGRRQLLGNNSWLHNSPRLMKGESRCTLLMHADDARARGLAPGSRVRVRSRVGAVEVALELTDEIAPGVVSLPHGFGHQREGVELDVAKATAGASINDLTDEQRVDPLTGVAAFSGVPVTVERF